MDLADNESHSLSASGSDKSSVQQLLSAVTSWSQMRQHDNLVPLQTRQSPPPAFLKMRWMPGKHGPLSGFQLQTLKAVHVKAKLRYFEYDNNTKQIYFPGS
jgi:hypothetical protein